MGCDIHVTAQRLVEGKWKDLDFEPFGHRSYGVFAFLADVRNYSHVPPIVPQRGYPPDFDAVDRDEYHSASWLSVAELAGFNYDATFEDRRTTAEIAPGCFSGREDAGPGNGRVVTYREFLGSAFFEDLADLVRLGATRIVFDFDS